MNYESVQFEKSTIGPIFFNSPNQGDRMARIFDQRVIVYFGQFFRLLQNEPKYSATFCHG
jgi:hypothetical protein